MNKLTRILTIITLAALVFRYVKSDNGNCTLRPISRPSNTVEYHRSLFLKVFNDEEHKEKNYTISDKYKMEKRFTLEIPCGMMEYDPASSIIYGDDVPDKAWPWQVFVHNDEVPCGGVLIDAQWVLTAAHCVDNKSTDFYVKLGKRVIDYDEDSMDIPASIIVVHDDYDNEEYSQDIALIKLDSQVNFTDRVRPACLPVFRQKFHLNEFCYITGYGDQETKDKEQRTLKQLKVFVVPDKECSYLWGTKGDSVDRGAFCVGKTRQIGGACSGDSGGPLSCKIGNKYYVAGVLSFGADECFSEIVPDVYTKVSMNINWIFHVLEKFHDF